MSASLQRAVITGPGLVTAGRFHSTSLEVTESKGFWVTICWVTPWGFNYLLYQCGNSFW